MSPTINFRFSQSPFLQSGLSRRFLFQQSGLSHSQFQQPGFFHFLLLQLFLLSLLCASCSSSKPAASQQQTRVELRTETVYVPDTVYIDFPHIIQNNITLDTLSVLENRYAKSRALVENGILHHSLELNPIREPATIQKQIIYKDSIIIQEVDVDHYIDVPAKLTPWQRFKLTLGGYSLVLIILLLATILIRILLR